MPTETTDSHARANFAAICDTRSCQGPNVWSRRLTQEHRVVYLVAHDRVDFLQARYHD